MYINYELLGFPSFYAHCINGLLLLVAFICLFKNYNYILHLDKYRLLVIILLFSIAIGVHGVSHLGLEKGYGYNPLFK
jgi:hypothetical protein